MDDGLKQRLIGAIVLVAAAVIFIPILFGEREQRSEDILVNVPDRPVVPKLEVQRPVAPGREADDRQPEAPAQPPATEVADQQAVTEGKKTTTTNKVAFDDKALPVSWTLQLASFQTSKNAEVLRDKLRKKGYRAYIRSRPDQNPEMIRVYIGPETDKTRLEKLRTALQKELDLKGIVVRFVP